MAVADLETDMSARATELERFVRDWYERGVNEFDLSFVDEMVDDNLSGECHLWDARGKQGIRDSYTRVNNAFSDKQFTIDYIFVKPDPSQDEVTIWYTFTAKFTGDLVLEEDRGTIPATGEPVEFHGASLLFIRDWKMCGGRVHTDMYDVLGVHPPPVKR